MATRTISTRVAIEGESAYKQSVDTINAALGSLKVQLNAVKTEYANNANSLDALRAKSELLSKTQDAQREKIAQVSAALENAKTAQAGYAAQVSACESRVKASEAALAALKASAQSTSEAEARLTETLEKQREELAQAGKYNEAAQRGVNSWQRQLSTAETALAKTNKEITANSKYLAEAAASNDGCATSIDQYGKKVKQAGEETKKAAEETKDASAAVDALASSMAADMLKGGFNAAKDAISACVTAAADFEQAMSGVAALSGASGAELDALAAKAKELGAATQYTAGETAQAFQYMALAGWDTGQMLAGIEPVLNLAAAAGMELAQASDLVTDYLTAFGLSAQDAEGFVD